jgi:hypothetical protein
MRSWEVEFPANGYFVGLFLPAECADRIFRFSFVLGAETLFRGYFGAFFLRRLSCLGFVDTEPRFI